MTDGLGESSQPDVDLLMASLRADAADAGVYFGALCDKLTDALGARASVTRGRRRSRKDPNTLTVQLADEAFTAELDGGSISCAVRHVVKGITLRTEDLGLASWLQALVDALAAEAQRSESTRVALERLLT